MVISLLAATVALSSCVKLYEEEELDIVKRPQTDIEIPTNPSWDDNPDNDADISLLKNKKTWRI